MNTQSLPSLGRLPPLAASHTSEPVVEAGRFANATRYASIEDLQAWAATVMERAPDYVIGDDYLRRWWIVPRNPLMNVYLHEILHSDDDRALHDHPWANQTLVIDGGYQEVTPAGDHTRTVGEIIYREATDLHRLVVPAGGRAVTLFITGPVVREWGFACPQGWRHWRDFVDERDSGQIGRGCGEMSA